MSRSPVVWISHNSRCLLFRRFRLCNGFMRIRRSGGCILITARVKQKIRVTMRDNHYRKLWWTCGTNSNSCLSIAPGLWAPNKEILPDQFPAFNQSDNSDFYRAECTEANQCQIASMLRRWSLLGKWRTLGEILIDFVLMAFYSHGFLNLTSVCSKINWKTMCISHVNEHHKTPLSPTSCL